MYQLQPVSQGATTLAHERRRLSTMPHACTVSVGPSSFGRTHLMNEKSQINEQPVSAALYLEASKQYIRSEQFERFIDDVFLRCCENEAWSTAHVSLRRDCSWRARFR